MSAYSGALNDDTAVVNSERTLLQQMDAPTVESTALKSDRSAFAQALDRLRQDAFEVTFIGSQQTSTAIDSLLKTHQNYYDKIAVQVPGIAAQQTVQNLSVGNADDYNRGTAPMIAKNLGDFIRAARRTLELSSQVEAVLTVPDHVGETVASEA